MVHRHNTEMLARVAREISTSGAISLTLYLHTSAIMLDYIRPSQQTTDLIKRHI